MSSPAFLALKAEVMNVVTPAQQALGTDSAAQDPASPKKPEHAARKVQEVAGAIGGALGLPLQLLNTGFALATSKISDMLPKFPAATLGSLYIGPPHCHSHPLSFIPPAPPVPLPSIGAILYGTSVKVFINGLPAARAGDIGLAPTCFGFTPFFEVKTGSSKVFIGGQRAARAIDFCLACTSSAGGGMDKLAKATLAIGMLASAAGVVADAQEAGDASAEGDAAMASAKTMAAAMGAAQMAADIATMAIRAVMGKDPSVPPVPSFPGLIVLGSPKVLIGGFPMVNFPDPLAWLVKKLKAKFGKGKKDAGKEGCPTCPI